ncbi:uncharacterized protein K452DRAFT_361969 [Aplosporella prunicola CBS 121167]|uniref:Uncharacterized protein n=1 Tax=Aplosporella prunicola CBS 121167 TaxID=1176127 RepID=A0A6A6B240_9PEZI|nr:uncharacterized protein K452DRAFT_361969 [Aplosporella prunicola CBS 121167]KAF2137294.1 hypothetical protein K452DRAFT_361969 [Aplosporella prunicola CBS 121167]
MAKEASSSSTSSLRNRTQYQSLIQEKGAEQTSSLSLPTTDDRRDSPVESSSVSAQCLHAIEPQEDPSGPGAPPFRCQSCKELDAAIEKHRIAYAAHAVNKDDRTLKKASRLAAMEVRSLKIRRFNNAIVKEQGEKEKEEATLESVEAGTQDEEETPPGARSPKRSSLDLDDVDPSSAPQHRNNNNPAKRVKFAAPSDLSPPRQFSRRNHNNFDRSSPAYRPGAYASTTARPHVDTSGYRLLYAQFYAADDSLENDVFTFSSSSNGTPSPTHDEDQDADQDEDEDQQQQRQRSRRRRAPGPPPLPIDPARYETPSITLTTPSGLSHTLLGARLHALRPQSRKPHHPLPSRTRNRTRNRATITCTLAQKLPLITLTDSTQHTLLLFSRRLARAARTAGKKRPVDGVRVKDETGAWRRGWLTCVFLFRGEVRLRRRSGRGERSGRSERVERAQRNELSEHSEPNKLDEQGEYSDLDELNKPDERSKQNKRNKQTKPSFPVAVPEPLDLDLATSPPSSPPSEKEGRKEDKTPAPPPPRPRRRRPLRRSDAFVLQVSDCSDCDCDDALAGSLALRSRARGDGGGGGGGGGGEGVGIDGNEEGKHERVSKEEEGQMREIIRRLAQS